MDVNKKFIYQSFEFQIEGNGSDKYSGLITLSDFNPVAKKLIIESISIANSPNTNAELLRSGFFYLESSDFPNVYYALVASGADPASAILKTQKYYIGVTSTAPSFASGLRLKAQNELKIGYELTLVAGMAALAYLKIAVSIGYTETHN